VRIVPTDSQPDYTADERFDNFEEPQTVHARTGLPLDALLAELHRATRRAERASQAMCERLNAGDFDGAQDCAGEFRAAMAEHGRAMRACYGEVQRAIAGCSSATRYLHETAVITEDRVVIAQHQSIGLAAIAVTIVVFGTLILHILEVL
jgi:hypothetical protein